MKKIIYLLVAFIVTITLGACQNTPDDSTFVVGLECDYAPFNWLTNDDSAYPIAGTKFYCDGYDVEIAKMIAKELGRELVIKAIDWESLIFSLNANEIDAIIAGMSPTPARMESVSFTNPYFVSEQVMVVRASSSYAQAEGLSDFYGARIIAQADTLQDGLISQIEGAIRRPALENYPLLVQAVSSGDSDALIAELPVAQSIVANNPNLTIVHLNASDTFELDESDITVSIALRHNDVDLLNAINEILDGIDLETRTNLMMDALEREE